MNRGAEEGAAAGWATDQWFVVQLKPNSAKRAERNLSRQGFRVFAPFEEATVRSGRHFKLVARPLFPGYFFVSFDPVRSPWRSINGTYGVARLISFSTVAPTLVPAALIRGLLAHCDSTGKYLSHDLPHGGDRVRIVAGPFAEFIATVDKIEPQRRVWVLLDILGASARIAVNANDLRLAS